MDCLIVDPHYYSDPTRSLRQTRFGLLTLYDLASLSGSRVNRVLTARIANGRAEKGSVENGGAMDGRRGSRRLPRITGGGPINSSIHPVGQLAWSNRTSGPVHTDRTDTPNLASAVSGSACRVLARGVQSKTAA
jgi:hypothetical protein